MGLIETVQTFNSLDRDLARLKAFTLAVNTGKITVKTDGQGAYWASFQQFNEDSGAFTMTLPLHVDLLTEAQTEMAALGSIIQNATVVP